VEFYRPVLSVLSLVTTWAADMMKFIAARMSDGPNDPWMVRFVVAVGCFAVLGLSGIGMAFATGQVAIPLLVVGTWISAWTCRDFCLPRRHRSYARQQERIRDSDLQFWLDPTKEKT
jgi:fatty acid desaturase